ncbi:helix-turn-helix domain-containing protein [Micromonospora sp. WMMD998]|uniref:helix-turn-helix domain-containing protein n=1 Tax=Micromonospora sp. WMMD998 TaxID=3016092 RepID=UPI002499E472|nr:helix-turn-helix domain-containing protein [Micromonospora sp. WMMD998]WFE39722.1 helix-turn-helix domain-containing protein [Micromonospora sp. WMMD998]
MLERLGLSAADEAVYWAMLDNPTWDVDDLIRGLDMPETAVHDALAALADRAMILPSSSRPGELRAVSPQLGLLALLDQAEQRTVAEQAGIQATRASVLARAASRDGHREREEIVRLKGIDEVRDRLSEHARTVAESVMMLTVGRAIPPQIRETGGALSRMALARGVTIRHIYQETLLKDPASCAYAEAMAEYGEESRVMPGAPMRMTLVDRRIALLPSASRAQRGAVEIRSARLVSALCLLFDLLWEKSVPLSRPAAGTTDGLTEQASAILRLLRCGRTDEAIGRQLGMSERTVRRTVADLMKRLDADSRFQAGVEAALRGWI